MLQLLAEHPKVRLRLSSNAGGLESKPTRETTSMLFMVIERFAANDMVPIYQRVRSEGRMLPDGLEYIARVRALVRWRHAR